MIVDDIRKAPGLQFGDARLQVHARLVCLPAFRMVVEGFSNADLRIRVAELLGIASMSAAQVTYDLRRLRLHGIIERIPHTFRYQLPPTGSRSPPATPSPTTGCYGPQTPQLIDPDLPSDLRTAYTRLHPTCGPLLPRRMNTPQRRKLTQQKDLTQP